jgi:hypothetical protein
MECTCFSGYCLASEAADRAELEALSLPTEPDDNLISENDLPIGAYDDDHDDIGIALSAYVNGYVY